MEKDLFVKLSFNNPKDYVQARTNMLTQQIRTWDVTNEKILTLFYTIPREDFVPPEFKPLAFADLCIPLSRGQSMMTPRDEAKILQELEITEKEKVLVLGGDSGFLVTVISKLAKHVFYIDNDLPSFEHLKKKIEEFKLDNVTTIIGSIHHGWEDLYPFDVIILTGSMPYAPETMKKALTIKGRLFVVVGDAPAMDALVIKRVSKNTWSERKLFETDRPRMLDVKEPEAFVF